MRYKLKDEYKDMSIAPSGKTVVLQYLNQEQIKLVIKAGYSDFFEELDSNTKKTSKKDKK
tara:strand:- start:1206 stop:1385 length:180 start_codon:yes stop_codon:yes gene_type:complete